MNFKRNDLQDLEEEIHDGTLFGPQNVPADVITMNSTACLADLNSGEESIYTLVFPVDADLQQNKISILTTLGTAMLGCRVGDIFACKTPNGVRWLRVKGLLHQPEAVDHYQLL